MSVTQRRLRQAVAVALVGFTALSAAAACSKKNEEPGGGTGSGGTVNLTLDTFGEFGYDELIKTYESQNPNVKITQRKTAKLDDYKPKLTQYLNAKTGAGDVVALEEGILLEFKANAGNWVDLQPLVGDLSAEYLSWKWEGGKSADGKLIGLPTDVGSLAMCYRSDLFQAAGLPTTPDEVTALWPTWDKFIEVGKTYRSKTNKGLLDSATTPFSAVLFQQGDPLFYDKSNNVVVKDSAAVKTAWDTSIKMINANITAKIKTWSPDWNAGFKQGTFAVVACPSWMLGIIETNSGPENKGKWGVAGVPGGGGNWGGSWLAVPEQSKNKEEAAKLAKFLTNTSSQVEAFKAKGPLPTNLKALDDPAFQAYKNAYFSDAPVGKIFGEGAKSLKPVYLGPKHQAIKEGAIEPALQAIEEGKLTPEAAWTQALKDAETKGK
jgi:cellobiose transport system substrate-binding protein